MKLLVNSYGKTWHTWHTGSPGDPLPYGDAALMWPFNREGEADDALLENRDRAMKLDTDAKRHNRRDLAALARPQRNVDTLKGAFPGTGRSPRGWRDIGDGPRT